MQIGKGRPLCRYDELKASRVNSDIHEAAQERQNNPKEEDIASLLFQSKEPLASFSETTGQEGPVHAGEHDSLDKRRLRGSQPRFRLCQNV